MEVDELVELVEVDKDVEVEAVVDVDSEVLEVEMDVELDVELVEVLCEVLVELVEVVVLMVVDVEVVVVEEVEVLSPAAAPDQESSDEAVIAVLGLVKVADMVDENPFILYVRYGEPRLELVSSTLAPSQDGPLAA